MGTLLALLFFVPFLAAAQPAAPTPPEASLAPISVLSFNLRYDNPADGENRWPHRKAMAARLIKAHGADLVGLQEAQQHQLLALLEALPEYAFVGVGRDDGKAAGEFSAILYRKARFEPLESGTFWLSEKPEAPGSKSWGTACTRVCTWARFKDATSGRALYHFNTHLDHHSQEARLHGSKLINERIQSRTHAEPVIVTGDFNAGEENPATRLFTAPGALTGENTPARFLDTFRVVHPGERNVGTFHGFKGTPGKDKIDYVLVSPGLETLSADIDRRNNEGRYPSDHFIVSATVRLTEAQAPAPTGP